MSIPSFREEDPALILLATILMDGKQRCQNIGEGEIKGILIAK